MAAPLTSAPVFADLASHAEASKATHLRALLDDVERSGALMAEHGGKYLAPPPHCVLRILNCSFTSLEESM